MIHDTFLRLFRGRADAYGAWHGQCVRAPLTPEHFERHLTSPNPADWIGVYNVIGDRCSWGCVDIDVPDFGLATNIRTALQHKGVPGWVEQTDHGYHVWVFPSPPLVPATVMRRALTVACRAVGYSPKEVFPKQDRVLGNGLGNYVRLPFNGFCSPSNHTPRMFMEWMQDTDRWVFEEFLVQMDRDRAEGAVLNALAELSPRPQRVDFSVDFQAGVEIEDAVAEIGNPVYRIWRDGPAFERDRSTTLVYMARLMAERDVPPTVAAKVLSTADHRWGKRFVDRGEAGLAILQRIIDKAYRG